MIIFKFELNSPGASEIELPMNATILSVGFQGTTLVLWAELNPNNAKSKRKFIAVETGKEFVMEPHDRAQYIGTASTQGTDVFSRGIFHYVVHVFEVRTEKPYVREPELVTVTWGLGAVLRQELLTSSPGPYLDRMRLAAREGNKPAAYFAAGALIGSLGANEPRLVSKLKLTPTGFVVTIAIR